ncbi:MAG: cyclic nucleotide-binding domain-containing protein [Candidatus Marinimicrobia bacterium]|nr:cyclic nucleotide-binding domain-containing protein [Candidatus Neomarinimicrobiota bacterium]
MNLKPMFSKKVKFSKGTIIMKEGDKGGPFYILLEGKCEILKRDFPLTTISKKGIIFGEMSLILNIPRTATVIAYSDVEAYEVDINFDDIFNHYPKTTKSIMRTLAKRVVNQNDVIYGYIVDEEMVEFDENDKEE